VLVIVVLSIWGDAAKIWTSLFLAYCSVWAYDAVTTWRFGGTPAKRILGLRVVQLDHVGPPTAGAAIRRGAVVAALTCTPVIGWGVLLASTVGEALRRGVPDRLAATMVVPDRFAATVTTRDLPGFADGARPPRMTALGRVADLDVRARARLRRLDDAPTLGAAIGLLALAVSLPFTTGEIVLFSSAAWIVIFVAHETWLVHRTGATPGHDLAGIVIVHHRTGQRPSGPRSFLRALVVGLTLYVPPLWLFLGISLLMMRYTGRGRGLHDLVGGTIVISDPRLDGETQRQRSMRMRLGRAG